MTDFRRLLENAYSGLLWNKQYYEYDVKACNAVRTSALGEKSAWNPTWDHFKVQSVLSMPDKWEFPWFASWDLCLQLIPLSDLDPKFCQQQLELMMSPQFMTKDGQLPGCEFDLSDPNPCLQGLACWEVFKKKTDWRFLESIYPRLRLSLQWWWHRRQTLPSAGGSFFEAGFLGLDNISVIDRSRPPDGLRIFQCDAFSWVFLLLLNCLQIAWTLRRARRLPVADVSQLLTMVAELQNSFRHIYDGIGCDLLVDSDGHVTPLVIKSYVALTPLLARHSFRDGPQSLMRLAKKIPNLRFDVTPAGHLTISLLTEHQLRTLLQVLVTPESLIGPFGVRSLSAEYALKPFTIELQGISHTLTYTPGESDSNCFGGNSNWRGPVWICFNYLIIVAIRTIAEEREGLSLRYLGSRKTVPLQGIWRDLCERIFAIFSVNDEGRRPLHGDIDLFSRRGPWSGPDYVLFFEYFNGDTGKGCGANHQTGWTALLTAIAKLYFTDSVLQ